MHALPTTVAKGFETLTEALFADGDADAVLESLVARVCRDIDGCDHAGISLLRPRRGMSTPVATAPIVVELAMLQDESREGPCVEAIGGGHTTIYSPDVTADARWPRFAPTAGARGIGSVLVERIATGSTVGALHLYAARTDAFSDGDQSAARLYAEFAAVAIAYAHERFETLNLREALASRDVIGQAKGILMEREKITADEAFEILRRVSQHKNRKLRDVAEEISRTGEAPSH